MPLFKGRRRSFCAMSLPSKLEAYLCGVQFPNHHPCLCLFLVWSDYADDRNVHQRGLRRLRHFPWQPSPQGPPRWLCKKPFALGQEFASHQKCECGPRLHPEKCWASNECRPWWGRGLQSIALLFLHSLAWARSWAAKSPIHDFDRFSPPNRDKKVS